MNQSKKITSSDLSNIKKAAKRLGKFVPENKHAMNLDIATYQILGLKTYREAIKVQELQRERDLQEDENARNQAKLGISFTKYTPRFNYGEMHDLKSSHSHGDWHFYSAHRALVFEGEFSPYPIEIDRLNSSAKLLDFILQIQKKKWNDKVVEITGISSTYQVDSFVSLIDELCQMYLNNSIQGVYSPGGNSKTVDWEKVSFA
ncbi:hypothetical protein O2V57_004381 [Vibrio parahaemolyticus]|uniref:hypothetical protein n=2 Tax=Vibrio parahaemolyticus TaxID=670 RepID=UPI000471E504|nr:hypothetical protein [Vibrio parahaemolyticus]EGQ8312686.1 hypothetical protein [Vibrio parahaemolyticus]EGQ8853039.1 hypothetical protein [Vibrio parahaemolyticus]EGQ8857691.1 hypothetical protein [Vibrio parahaemolyticus]EGQ8877151.1 hypothetical protein [Vibrio parahaemolyticus]EGQ8996349.1 hypothetical protein [Vibrio parahaemolyticus]